MCALCLALGCGDEEPDDDNGDSGAGTEADPSGQGSGPGSGSGPGPDDDSEPDDDGEGEGESSSGEPEDDACFGDWYLGEHVYSGEAFLEACDQNPPQNCIGGTYIVFNDTDECICLPDCGAVGLSEGEECTTGGITCTRIENDSNTSSGVFCAPPDWNLCG